MIDVMAETSGNMIGFRLTGKRVQSDYDDVLTPRLASLIEEYGAARALIFMGDNFKGWDFPAAWANTKLDFLYRKQLEKIAIVGAPTWEE